MYNVSINYVLKFLSFIMYYTILLCVVDQIESNSVVKLLMTNFLIQ